ncbi:MAG: hypothetical protein JW727_01195 [Candidatus Aenigmarchaeota archaeon]|nr:hypothetical protein [Candidatus Aenigmarchaeota archaeon]
MRQGNLTIEHVILLLIALLVLVVSYLFVNGSIKGPTNSTTELTQTYSECNKWRMFGYLGTDFSTHVDGKPKYPALWQTYVGAITNTPTPEQIEQAKKYCTLSQNSP